MPRDASWWLKVKRAAQHYIEMRDMVEAYEQTCPYRAERMVSHAKGQRHIWRYVVRVTQQPDPRMSVVIGEFVHDMRSALDHVAVAIAPGNRRNSAGFPICADDPGAKDDGEPRPRSPIRRRGPPKLPPKTKKF